MKKLKRLFANKSAIKNLYSKKMFGFAVAGAGFTALAQQAQAQIIIEDTFTYAGTHSESGHYLSARGAGNNGLPTDSNPTGPTYQGLAQANGYNTKEGGTGSGAYGQLYNGNGAAMTMGGASATNLEYTLTFAQTNPQSATGSQFSYFGFYSQASASTYTGNADKWLAGLVIDSSGNLYSDVAGTLSSPEAYGGTYVLGSTETLTFDLNTTTGALSNISLSGSSTAYSFSALGAVNDSFAGFSVNQNNTQLNTTNFEVSGIVAAPEPSTYALLAGGVLALGAYQYRRRQQYGI